jgi:predicted nucleic acid-binding protein
MRTVSNTSPISNLAIIGQLNLLREQFGEVWIPEAVINESNRISHAPTRDLILKSVETGWLVVQPVSDNHIIDALLSHLDRGEAEAIALASELKADLLLIDERDGRRVARETGLKVRGVLGVLLRAKKTGRLTAIKPLIELLKSRARFFIDSELEKTILADAGE